MSEKKESVEKRTSVHLLHPTESGSSQRGMSWFQWLGRRSGFGRTIGIALFLGIVMWMAITRWGACLSS